MRKQESLTQVSTHLPAWAIKVLEEECNTTGEFRAAYMRRILISHVYRLQAAKQGEMK